MRRVARLLPESARGPLPLQPPPAAGRSPHPPSGEPGRSPPTSLIDSGSCSPSSRSPPAASPSSSACARETPWSPSTATRWATSSTCTSTAGGYGRAHLADGGGGRPPARAWTSVRRGSAWSSPSRPRTASASATTAASSASSTSRRRGCAAPSTSRTTTSATRSWRRTSSPSPTSQPADWDKIREQHLSPLFVSVHATEPDVRRRLLGNPTAPDILEQLDRLAVLGHQGAHPGRADPRLERRPPPTAAPWRTWPPAGRRCSRSPSSRWG